MDNYFDAVVQVSLARPKYVCQRAEGMFRSCKGGKATAGSAASEYRAVLDNLLSDLLSTLHLPEWPASEILLGVFCRSIVSSSACDITI